MVLRFQDGDSGGDAGCDPAGFDDAPREAVDELPPIENGDGMFVDDPGCETYVMPRRQAGGEYVTPKSDCLQNGHVAGSDTSCSDVELGSGRSSPGVS